MSKKRRRESLGRRSIGWHLGQTLMVYSLEHAAWYKGLIKGIDGDTLRITYPGWGSDADEDVHKLSDRLDNYSGGSKKKWRHFGRDGYAYKRVKPTWTPTGALEEGLSQQQYSQPIEPCSGSEDEGVDVGGVGNGADSDGGGGGQECGGSGGSDDEHVTPTPRKRRRARIAEESGDDASRRLHGGQEAHAGAPGVRSAPPAALPGAAGGAAGSDAAPLQQAEPPGSLPDADFGFASAAADGTERGADKAVPAEEVRNSPLASADGFPTLADAAACPATTTAGAATAAAAEAMELAGGVTAGPEDQDALEEVDFGFVSEGGSEGSDTAGGSGSHAEVAGRKAADEATSAAADAACSAAEEAGGEAVKAVACNPAAPHTASEAPPLLVTARQHEPALTSDQQPEPQPEPLATSSGHSSGSAHAAGAVAGVVDAGAALPGAAGMNPAVPGFGADQPAAGLACPNSKTGTALPPEAAGSLDAAAAGTPDPLADEPAAEYHEAAAAAPNHREETAGASAAEAVAAQSLQGTYDMLVTEVEQLRRVTESQQCRIQQLEQELLAARAEQARLEEELRARHGEAEALQGSLRAACDKVEQQAEALLAYEQADFIAALPHPDSAAGGSGGGSSAVLQLSRPLAVELPEGTLLRLPAEELVGAPELLRAGTLLVPGDPHAQSQGSDGTDTSM
ncbi:hypothetical protein Agub_g1842 [Astrephomene gubernaculifera]|uniref:Uncharacterized protein n=1 Tax=Astrephomene gubernaculifera TaxID=47775 RepID=A0AAD3DG57_9CHLO|nr:hypothetical protein Agub_g1842 [Astrephomene gubernaculifera]